MRIVVTAGPTREPIDPVRFLSNRSSGKMGYAIAEAAAEAGHDVTLISGPVCIAPPQNVRVIQIVTSDELYERVREAALACDVLVMCAAVADYKPASFSPQKLQKRESPAALALTPTRDILASLPESRPCLVVGFAAETQNLEENAKKKLVAKNCDMIVANDVSRSDCGMESDENEVTVFLKTGEPQRIGRASKQIIARALLKIILEMREKRLTKKT